MNTIDTEEFYKFISRYKFVIAYENSVCSDYLTEKIWRPLTLGVVPVYFGAPNIEVRIQTSATATSQSNNFKPTQKIFPIQEMAAKQQLRDFNK